MKKLIAIPLSLVVCVSAFAQGQIAFQNNAATLVMAADDGYFGGGTTVVTSADGVDVQMFYQVDNGGAAPAAISPSGYLGNWIGLAITGITTIPGGGIFNGGVQTIPTLNVGNTGPGQLVWLDIVGWNNNSQATTLAAALGGASYYFGSSAVFAYTTGNPNELPTPMPGYPITTPSPGAFTGLIIGGVPEPSTLAISAVGAVSLLFFRRRK